MRGLERENQLHDLPTAIEMDVSEKDEAPMLSNTYPTKGEYMGSQSPKLSSRARSASMSTPRSPMESYESEDNFLMGLTGPLQSKRKPPSVHLSGPLYTSYKHENLFRPTRDETMHKTTERVVEKYSSLKGLGQDGWAANHGAKNEHLLRSGPLGMCSDPYCTTCPTYYNQQPKHSKYSLSIDSKLHTILYGDAKGWARRMYSHLLPYIPGVMNPHTKVVQQWNKFFFIISCLFAIFLDPLFFFPFSVQQDNMCIVINMPFTMTLVSFRTLTDLIYLMNMLLQFRLAYVSPETTVVGAGELIDDPKKIALNYLKGYFIFDLFVVLPLPQIVILLVIPRFNGSSGANHAKNLLRAAVLIQYVPRLCRFLPFFAGQSPSGFIFESAWANFVINLLTFVLSGHIVGSLWYLLGLQTVNHCLRLACNNSGIEGCMKFIDCGHGDITNNFNSTSTWTNWTKNDNATSCFNSEGPFSYGIYKQAVNLTAKGSIVTRYIYALFWGFQQISTLAGNQIPSYSESEVLFTMGIIGLGLLLFALLIGNMQNFLQALGRRRLEMSLKRRDVEQWMSHRRLPENLKRQVRQAERYNWAATRGVNEESLLDNLPEDLQREIRRHLFNSIKKVRIFAMMDEPILDAICAKLRQRTYIKGNRILNPGDLIDKMVFIVRGKMESSGEDNIKVPLSEGDVCGEELLTWYLQHSSVNKDQKNVRLPGPRLLSNRMITCFTNVEAFTLRAADLEEVTSLFSRFLRNVRVRGALRYDSPYCRSLAANRIQVAWRYRKRRLQRAETSGN